MRILLVTPLFFPSLSGAAVYFDTLIGALRAREPKLELTVLTRRVPGAPAHERRADARVFRLLPNSRLAAPVVVTAARLTRADIVHYHTMASYRGLPRLAPLVRAPLVGDMRDLAARNEGADLRHYLHCSRLICASENIVRFLTARGFPAAKLAHVPIPFSPPTHPDPARIAAARARYGLTPGRPYALFVGVIIPYKGVAELLTAIELVWRERPDLELVLAGPLTSEADAAFPGGFRAAVGGDPRIRWVGPVPHHEVPLLLAGADLFVLPSRTEGLPRSCLEAIALRRKIVLPPGIPEFDAACPEAVLADITPKAIAAKMLETLARGAPARYPLERHDPARAAALTLEVYRAAGA